MVLFSRLVFSGLLYPRCSLAFLSRLVFIITVVDMVGSPFQYADRRGFHVTCDE